MPVGTLIFITDPADPRLDDFRDLSTADRRPDRPGGRGLVVAEGTVVVRRLFSSAYPVRAVLGVERRIRELEPELPDVPAYVTPAGVMAEVVGFHLNRGVLAVADRAPMPAAAEILARSHTVAVLEGVGDHENLGALFRNAAALAVGGVLLGAGCADPLYRRSVRVSMGNVLRVPFASLDPWPSALEAVTEHGFRTVALTPRADAVDLRSLGPGKFALLVGSEGHGLTPDALAAADLTARIPMAPGVDSLNVATAAAIAFYELAAR
jgi:tRNA G18 (ribose-2'-O)-methylase SpoU